MSKRPDGALEHDISVTVLWATDQPLLPAEIKARLVADLQYTSVATVLGRLVGKGSSGALNRSGLRVHATVPESELATRRIATVMAATSNRAEVLAGFVQTLSPGDVAALRALLGSGSK